MHNNNTNLEHLGGGVVLFRNAIDIDFEWACKFAEDAVAKEMADMYTETTDPESGKKGFLNKSGYFFDYEGTMNMPRRGSAIHQNKEDEIINFLQFLEKSRDSYLIKYIVQFPLAYKNIWWKVKGHIVSYSTKHGGRFLGAHSDTSADYAYGYPHPSDQLATRNTLSCIIYLNDDFEGGEHFFNYLNIRYKPNKGDIMMFPSNFIAAHEVEPVTAGNRYTYLGWYSHGSPNPAVNEFIVDPITEPALAQVSTNVYMSGLRQDVHNYLVENNIDKDFPLWHLVESMHS